MTKLVAVLGVCTLVAGAARPALAGTAAEKCAQAKQKAAGKKIAGKMSCQSKAKLTSNPVDPNCLTKVEGKFSAAMTKAGSACPGDTAAIEALVDSCVATLVTDIPGNGPCPAASARAAGKAAGSELSCSAKDIGKPGSFGACHAKADGKLSAALGKAGACGPSGTLQADVDTCQTSIAGALPPTTTISTTSTSVTSTTSTSTTSTSTTSTSVTSTTSTSVTSTTSTSTTSTTMLPDLTCSGGLGSSCGTNCQCLPDQNGSAVCADAADFDPLPTRCASDNDCNPDVRSYFPQVATVKVWAFREGPRRAGIARAFS